MNKRNGFTLIELLVVLGVMTLLIGMLIPSVGIVREKAQRMATAHKVRQIALAVATYQSTTGSALSGSTLAEWMEALASESGLLASELFLFEEDPLMATLDQPPPTLVQREGNFQWSVINDFNRWPVGVAVASGVGPGSDPSHTPVVWTRGLQSNGSWRAFGQDRAGVYGAAGGFIGFLDGHVAYYQNLSEDGGQLVNYQTGARTSNISEALPPGVRVLDYRGQGL